MLFETNLIFMLFESNFVLMIFALMLFGTYTLQYISALHVNTPRRVSVVPTTTTKVLKVN